MSFVFHIKLACERFGVRTYVCVCALRVCAHEILYEGYETTEMVHARTQSRNRVCPPQTRACTHTVHCDIMFENGSRCRHRSLRSGRVGGEREKTTPFPGLEA